MSRDMRPEVFTADYVGRPGERSFYLQARGAPDTQSYLVEKEQVAALAERMKDLLLMIDADDAVSKATPGRDPALALETPVEPEWRAGTMGLSYDEDEDMVMLYLSQTGSEVEDDPEAFDVRLFLRRDQVRSFVLHATSAVGEGRPLCQLCGLPMDPDGHDCPARNGHRVEA